MAYLEASKKRQKPIEIIFQQEQALDLLDKDFKTTALNMLKEIKDTMDNQTMFHKAEL